MHQETASTRALTDPGLGHTHSPLSLGIFRNWALWHRQSQISQKRIAATSRIQKETKNVEYVEDYTHALAGLFRIINRKRLPHSFLN